MQILSQPLRPHRNPTSGTGPHTQQLPAGSRGILTGSHSRNCSGKQWHLQAHLRAVAACLQALSKTIAVCFNDHCLFLSGGNIISAGLCDTVSFPLHWLLLSVIQATFQHSFFYITLKNFSCILHFRSQIRGESRGPRWTV